MQRRMPRRRAEAVTCEIKAPHLCAGGAIVLEETHLDRLDRTPRRRRYDAAREKPAPRPDNEPEEDEEEPRERRRVIKLPPSQSLPKRHFELPKPGVHFNPRPPALMTACILLLLFCAQGSAPLQALPTVQKRFDDWVRAQNDLTVKALPGPTIEPNSTLAAILKQEGGAPEESGAVPAAAIPTPQPQATEEPSRFKHYEPGELSYESETLSVSIDQIEENGVTYYLADIQVSDPEQLRTAFAGEKYGNASYETVSDIADRHQPVIAANADFYKFHKNGIILRNGELYRKQNSSRHLMIVDSEGNMSALTDRREKQGVVANQLEKAGTWQTFEFGPVLVKDGEATTLPKSFFIRTANDAAYREPRTGIGQLGPLHYILIVVDGRRDGYSEGMTLPEFQQLFVKHGAQFAFNLDGGGSTTLYFQGEVVNMPSSGDERRVSDIVMFVDGAALPDEEAGTQE